MIKIELGDKIYECKVITGRMMLEHAKILDKISEKNIDKLEGHSAEFFEEECNFICKVFNNQFTKDELLDNIPAEDINLIILKVGEYISKKSEANIRNIIKN